MIIAFGSQGKNALSLLGKEKSIAAAKIDSVEGSSDIRYGLINYADIAGVYSELGEFKTAVETKDAIWKLPWAGEGTGLNNAISQATNEFRNNGRPEAYKIFIIFVTGPAVSSPKILNMSAQELFDLDVRVIPVLLGDDSDEEQVKYFVLDPKDIVKPREEDEPSSVAKDIDDTIAQGKWAVNVHLI